MSRKKFSVRRTILYVELVLFDDKVRNVGDGEKLKLEAS